MDKLRKIVLMAFIGVVLPCLSFAYPDFYFYDNFLVGSSPYIVDTSNYDLGENGLWEKYIPPLADTSDSSIKAGIVTTFSNDFMSGTSPKTAVPSVNLSAIGSGRIELQPGCAVVVYSDGDLNNAYSTVSISAIPLGFTAPSDYCIDDYKNIGQARIIRYMNALRTSDGTSFQSVPRGHFADFNNLLKTSSVFCWSSTSFLLSPQLESVNYAYSPYPDCSVVWLMINRSDSVAYVHANMGSGPIIDIDDIAYNGIKWIALASGNVNTTTTNTVIEGRKAFMIPHIDGDLDLYSGLFDELVSASNYAFTYSYNIHATLDFSSSSGEGWMYFQSTGYVNNNSYSRMYSSIDLETVDGSYIPLFLKSAVRYLSSTAIMVNGGYINITNYEDLVALLKEQGVGQMDLTRVIELLDEINTGGATGATVKELIDTVQSLENQIFNDMDTDSVTNVFDTYKSLLDFGQDLQWLIIANNKMFEIFAGVIMLSAFFIILNRVLR